MFLLRMFLVGIILAECFCKDTTVYYRTGGSPPLTELTDPGLHTSGVGLSLVGGDAGLHREALATDITHVGSLTTVHPDMISYQSDSNISAGEHLVPGCDVTQG